MNLYTCSNAWTKITENSDWKQWKLTSIFSTFMFRFFKILHILYSDYWPKYNKTYICMYVSCYKHARAHTHKKTMVLSSSLWKGLETTSVMFREAGDMESMLAVFPRNRINQLLAHWEPDQHAVGDETVHEIRAWLDRDWEDDYIIGRLNINEI